MEHLYTVHTKLVDNQTYYFVKKIMALPEFKGLADIVVGYGMHSNFEKACSIAGLDDKAIRQKLLHDLEERNKPRPTEKVSAVQFPEVISQWLAERGAEVLN